MIALIDIDDTIADTITVWIRRYNRKYNDKLKVSDIKNWDLAQYTVPECGDKIYDILERGNMYRYIKPIPHALEAIRALRAIGFEIAYATAGSPKASIHKYQWLVDNNFWEHEDHYIQTHSKHLVRGNLIVDDNYNNIEKSKASMKMLFDRPWNEQYNHFNRITDWKEITKDIEKYVEETQ